jgi:hypothetical protein
MEGIRGWRWVCFGVVVWLALGLAGWLLWACGVMYRDISDALRNVQGWSGLVFWGCFGAFGALIWADLVSFGSVHACLVLAFGVGLGVAEPESLILAQSERWRHA